MTHTALVVFSTKRVDPKLVNRRDKPNLRLYAFKIQPESVKVGERFKTIGYQTPIQVVQVLTETFEFVNTKTGDLSTVQNSTSQVPLQELSILRETPKNAVVAFPE